MQCDNTYNLKINIHSKFNVCRGQLFQYAKYYCIPSIVSNKDMTRANYINLCSQTTIWSMYSMQFLILNPIYDILTNLMANHILNAVTSVNSNSDMYRVVSTK